MDKLEKVELVREKTGVSYEQAKSALESNDYDVLDAIVELERSGKTTTQSANYSTAGAAYSHMSPEMEQAQSDYERSSRKGFGDAFTRACDVLKRLCRKGLDLSFSVSRRGKTIVTMPLLLLVLAFIFLLPFTVICLIAGLFLDCRYRIVGVDSVTVNINDVMDKAADSAQNLKKDVLDE